MAEDYIREIMNESISKILEEEISSGATEEEINRSLDKLLSQENLNKSCSLLLEKASDDSVDTIENIMYEKVLNERCCSDEFLARQGQIWGKAFVASEAMYICVLESAEHYHEFVCEEHREEENFLYYALRNIHGRALQIYLEILCLNKNGFADGAYARWRSLYELSIISSFIKKYGEKVARAFVRSANTGDRYEWAREAECFEKYSKKYITFSAIQANCELATKEWKREYDFVNKLVHASSQGTIYRLGSKTSKVVSVGQSDWGMSISAIHSAISLAQITADFFTVYQHGDSIMAMVTFHKWVNKINDYYKNVEEMFFSDDINSEYDNI